MTTEKLLQGLSVLGPGHSGRVTTAQLMEIEIPGIPDYEHKRRAEWLKDRLPFQCDLPQVLSPQGLGHTSKTSARICEGRSDQPAASIRDVKSMIAAPLST